MTRDGRDVVIVGAGPVTASTAPGGLVTGDPAPNRPARQGALL